KDLDNESIIELDNFDEYLMQIYDIKNKDQENKLSKFKFSYTVNISAIDGNSKDQADYIINAISNIDDYVWM
ncbi:19796_t:CDS:1, partial [Dentiscutata erythropus]